MKNLVIDEKIIQKGDTKESESSNLVLPLDEQIAKKIAEKYHILMVKNIETGIFIPYFYDGKKYVQDDRFLVIRCFIKEEIKAIANICDISIKIPASIAGYKLGKADIRNFRKTGYWNQLTRNVVNNISDMKNLHKTENDFNQNPYEINFRNGIYDIKSGRLTEHTFDVLTTNIINASYIQNCKTDEAAFIQTASVIHKIVRDALYDKTMGETENEKIANSFMDILASCLIGNNQAKQVYIVVGKPNTGKSTIFKILGNLFGDYCGTFNNGVLLESPRSSNDIRPDIISLRNKRLMLGSETNKGNMFDTGLVKTLAGNDTQSFRKPHSGQMVDFVIKGKFLLGTNYCPNFSNLEDQAFLNRLVIVDFNNIPENMDLSLEERALTDEARDQFMTWLANVAHEQADRSVYIHDRFKANKQRILVNQNNSVSLFWKEHIRPLEEYDRPVTFMHRHPVKVLYATLYLDFCRQISVKPLALETFGKDFKLLADQFPLVSWERGKSNNYYRGFNVEGGQSAHYYHLIDTDTFFGNYTF